MDLFIPDPDPPKAQNKLPQRHQATKSASGGLIFILASLCLGGVNVLPQNVIDPPLEGKKIIIKRLN